MKRKKILALADRVEDTPPYIPADLGLTTFRRIDKRRGRPDTRVILIQERYRYLIAEALRRFAE